jgi:hypothetical protein
MSSDTIDVCGRVERYSNKSGLTRLFIVGAQARDVILQYDYVIAVRRVTNGIRAIQSLRERSLSFMKDQAAFPSRWTMQSSPIWRSKRYVLIVEPSTAEQRRTSMRRVFCGRCQ